jgi:hypothetical protein
LDCLSYAQTYTCMYLPTSNPGFCLNYSRGRIVRFISLGYHRLQWRHTYSFDSLMFSSKLNFCCSLQGKGKHNLFRSLM